MEHQLFPFLFPTSHTLEGYCFCNMAFLAGVIFCTDVYNLNCLCCFTDQCWSCVQRRKERWGLIEWSWGRKQPKASFGCPPLCLSFLLLTVVPAGEINHSTDMSLSRCGKRSLFLSLLSFPSVMCLSVKPFLLIRHQCPPNAASPCWPQLRPQSPWSHSGSAYPCSRQCCMSEQHRATCKGNAASPSCSLLSQYCTHYKTQKIDLICSLGR